MGVLDDYRDYDHCEGTVDQHVSRYPAEDLAADLVKFRPQAQIISFEARLRRNATQVYKAFRDRS
jgi:hypothetical protein